MLIDDGVGDEPHNRGQDTVVAAAAPTPIMLVNPTQLHNKQPDAPFAGLRLAYGEDQQLQLFFQDILINIPSPIPDMPTLIKQQRGEIDQVLRTHGDQLRITFAERGQKHYRALISAVEESVPHRLREKETQLEKAARRKVELEDQIARFRAKKQFWHTKAERQEGTTTSLQAQLQQALREKSRQEFHMDDAVSSSHINTEDAVLRSKLTLPARPTCKLCWRRAASVLMFPCRHLCLCTICNTATVKDCPVCVSVKSASVEVYFV